MSNLTTVIKSIQDVMRQDSGVDGDAQRISQLTWLLFLKVFDAQEEELELTRDSYRSPLPEPLRWRSWAADPEGVTGDSLLDFVNGQLFPKLKGLPGDPERNPRGYVVRGVFEDAYNYMKSGQLLRQVINKLNAVDFNRQAERHQFNDIYEKILRDLQSAGNAGEFYTPRAVTQFIVDMVNPRLGEVVLDPACGTGGFLICSLEHLRKQVKNEQDEVVLQKSVRGVEKKQLPHMLCVTNMMLHGVEVPSLVAHDNTLTRPLRDYTAADRVDVIVTNPPFGGVEEPGTENNFPADVRTKETADLFLVLIKHLLKPGGRGALVLPDGTLFGEGVKSRIKEQLLAECNLHTIVRLPGGVFSPYTGIKTNMLFFTKGQPTKEIWYYEHQYPTGMKTYNKTKPIRIEEFDAEKAWWGIEADGFRSRVEGEFAWKVSIETIKLASFNLDQKNPHAPDLVSHDPDELLCDYSRLQSRAQGVRDQLRTILSAETWQRIAQHFDLLLDRPEAIRSFEQAILQGAVRGLLVSQADEDEPAAALVERIFLAKAQLPDRARARVPGPMSAVDENDLGFPLPKGWIGVRFGDITVNRDGERVPVSAADREGLAKRYDYYGASGVIDKIDKFIFDKRLLLIGEDGANLLNRSTPIAFFAEGKYWVNNHAHVIDATEPGLLDYLCLYVNAISLEPYVTGTAQPKMNQAKLNSIPVALPPLAEQRRIVVRVEELRRLCTLLRDFLTSIREVKSRLADALVAEVI
jgi:type I restriction enzyme M protein